MSLRNSLNLVVISTIALILNACGGGGSTTANTGTGQTNTNNTSNTNTGLTNGGNTVAYTEWAPSAATLVAKRTVPGATRAWLSNTFNQGCNKSNQGTIVSTTVYEGPNSIVYAATDVSEKDQQEVFEFLDSAIVEIRAKYGSTATVGFSGKKMEACVQNEPLNNVVGVPAGAQRDNIFVQSANTFFNSTQTRSSLIAGHAGKNYQDFYHRILAHEMTHSYEATRSDDVYQSNYLDSWFSEGIARFNEFGKSIYTNAEMQALFAKQNPMIVLDVFSANSPQLSGNGGYPAAAAVIHYLFSPTGANNPISAYNTMIDKIKAEWTVVNNKCLGIPAPASCPFTTQRDPGYNTTRDAIFVRAFESTFKEKDGSAMKLRAGVNNLQDSIASRIAAFW
jgi:hypothetical protein